MEVADAADGQLVAVSDADLLPAIRNFRAGLRNDLEYNKRHLEGSMRELEIAAALDPRYKDLGWMTVAKRQSPGLYY